MVGDEVPGDRDEPPADVAALPGEGFQPSPGAHEGVAGDVLGEGVVADPGQDEPENDLRVAVVELTEGVDVALLGALDELARGQGSTCHRWCC